MARSWYACAKKKKKKETTPPHFLYLLYYTSSILISMHIYSTIYIGMVQNLLDYGYCGIVVTVFKGVTQTKSNFGFGLSSNQAF